MEFKSSLSQSVNPSATPTPGKGAKKLFSMYYPERHLNYNKQHNEIYISLFLPTTHGGHTEGISAQDLDSID